MKICLNCQIPLTRPRSNTCEKCVKKKISDTYFKKNKEKIKLYQKEYREKNKQLCQERSKLSTEKKKEYYRLKRRESYRKNRGIPLDDPFKKRKNGEGTIDKSGYKTITIKGHPNQMDKKGRIREHVYVMSEYLKRPLIKGETVHHKNGDRLDNRIENLELWDRSQPAGQRVENKIQWCIEFLIQYGYKVYKD